MEVLKRMTESCSSGADEGYNVEGLFNDRRKMIDQSHGKESRVAGERF